MLILLEPLRVPATFGVYLLHPTNTMMRPYIEVFKSAIRFLDQFLYLRYEFFLQSNRIKKFQFFDHILDFNIVIYNLCLLIIV
jgi:hypothetical protein